MKVKIIIISLFVMIVSCGNSTKSSEKTTIKYKTYTNEQFGYTVLYPEFLLPQGEAGNKDGQKFISKDGNLQQWVYRAFKMDLETMDTPTLEKAFQTDLQDKNVIAKSLKNNVYTIKSMEGETISLQYSFLIENEYYDILFIYPKKEETQMKNIANKVTKSFKKIQ